ncbi:hypothetical protein Cni_G02942 [Canna indica]|uniref:BHLH domain-containing protein n=1 Tax=Canna indica TaxID=4628 RepID=A0AAQ3Q2M2_9LILI|nr:hypothetical protein Cni_G02942 [Canna indica]
MGLNALPKGKSHALSPLKSGLFPVLMEEGLGMPMWGCPTSGIHHMIKSLQLPLSYTILIGLQIFGHGPLPSQFYSTNTWYSPSPSPIKVSSPSPTFGLSQYHTYHFPLSFPLFIHTLVYPLKLKMSSRRSRISEEEINELISKLQSLLPETRRCGGGRVSKHKTLLNLSQPLSPAMAANKVMLHLFFCIPRQRIY